MGGLGDRLRYVYDGLSESYDDPYWWRERVFEFLVGPFHTNVYPGRDGAASVMAEDWDTLVVLDACRVDLFEERADTAAYDDYGTVTSRGSTTREWVRQNFTGREFGDTVYVTANPYVSREAGDAFHHLVECWRTDFDDERGTVPAEAVARAGIEAHERFPNKRVVLHFMQPHHPFVGERELTYAGWQIEGESHADGEERRERPYTPWDALWMGLVDRESLWESYGDNLTYALDAVADVFEAVDGRIVVTSDHGNMLGERTFPIPLRVYGHPKGVRNRELVEVPWAVRTTGPRREVADDGAGGSRETGAEVERRLEDLGYV